MSAIAAQSAAIHPAAPRWRAAVRVPPGFIAVAEAVRIAASSAEYAGSRKPGAVRKWVQRVADQARDAAVAPVMVEGRLYLPRSLHPAFQRIEPVEAGAEALAALPAARRNRALCKLAVLRDVDAFCATPEGRALGRVAAVKRFVARRANHYSYAGEDGERCKLPISFSSIYAWRARRRTGGIAALAEDGRGGYDREGPSAEAIDAFKALYFDPKKFSKARCYKTVADLARKHGWRWFRSFSACKAWARRALDRRAAILFREGERAYRTKCEPFIEPDPESFAPGECWMADHTAANAWVRIPSGRVVRPFVTAFMDWRSRAIVGLSVGVVGSQDSILLALRDAATRHGLPEVVQLDNGRDFTAYVWTGGRPRRHRHAPAKDFADRAEGLFNLLGIRTTWGLPYNPNSKARIEAGFRHLDGFCKTLPSYCGNTPSNRPDAHAKIVKRAVSLAEFESKLRAWIEAYNNSPHSGEGMDGLAPNQVLAQAPSKRVLTDAQALACLAAWPRPVRVHRNGVTIRLAGESFSYGAFDPVLQALPIGTPVRVSYDPADMSRVAVWSTDWRFVCYAENNRRINRAVGGEALREALRAKRRARKAHKASRAAGLTHLADTFALALEGQRGFAKHHRKPDPTPPAGGLVLKPVRTPIDADSQRRAAAEQAAAIPAAADAADALRRAAREWEAERKQRRGAPRIDPLLAWREREAANA